jgi:hypothetical protein
MSSAKTSLGILQRISEFLADLPEDQLEDLAHGRASLAYVPAGASDPVVPQRSRSRAAAGRPAEPSPDTAEIRHRLETTMSRDEAAGVIAALKKPALVDIARALSVPAVTKLTIADLRTEIVESTVGRRLDSIAIRGFDGDRP